MKLLEIKTIEHKGIKIAIKIDYKSGTVSLVDDRNHNFNEEYPVKSFIFAGRGLEYMNNWLTILEAMTVAVKECKKELEADLAEKSKFSNEFIEKAAMEQLKVRKGKKL